MPPTIFISAGEASGEHYGAMLMDSLQRQSKAQGRGALKFIGMGGPRMVAAGLDRIVRAEDVAVMGITEIVHHLPRIYSEFRKLKTSIRQRRPDIAILIDFPDIHFALAKEFHAQGIPVIFFVSPQLWAWKKGRIKKVQKYIDKMLVIFPFEEPFYREHNVNAEFVGHPLADQPLPAISREEYAKQATLIHQDQWNYGPGPGDLPEGTSPDPVSGEIRYELDPQKEWIALLPGSRYAEISSNFRAMVDAACNLGSAYEYIVPIAPTISERQLKAIQYDLGDLYLPDNPPRITFVHDARAALFHAKASIVASGTATVEAALIGNPFVVVYRVSPLTYAIAKRVVTVPHVAMVNLIAGKRLVPELIQHDFTASNIVEALRPLLSDGPGRQSMMQGLAALRGLLHPHHGQTAIDRVGEIVIQMLHSAPGAQMAAGALSGKD
jgi:lipid-A-disaccharide synthase